MKILHQNFKKGEIKIKVENLDDLWYLHQLIDEGDLIKGKTVRKIKIGEKEQRKINIIKKPVFIEIKAEKVEYSKTINALRISGTIIQCPEEIQKGSHHTFNVETNSIITIIKQEWLKFQLDKLREACSQKISKILIVVLDREEAFFALMKKYGYELLAHIKGTVQKKANIKEIKSSFYSQLIKQIEEYDKRYQLQTIIVASPAFWKEELLKNLKNKELKNKIIKATCSSVSESAINEVLKRPETQQALKQDRIAKEINLVESLLVEIKKNGLAAYGLEETKNAVNAGAVKLFLITDSMIRKTREENTYKAIEIMMKTVEKTKGSVNIISSDNEAGKKLDGLGGIAAILRYKLNY